jgi:hypothetical protein
MTTTAAAEVAGHAAAAHKSVFSRMRRPIFLLVSEDVPRREALTADLKPRYDADYQSYRRGLGRRIWMVSSTEDHEELVGVGALWWTVVDYAGSGVSASDSRASWSKICSAL